MRPDEKSQSPREYASQPLVVVAAAMAAGIVTDRYCPLGWWTWIGLMGVGLGAWLLLWRRHWHGTAMIFLTLAVASVGGAWHHSQWDLFPGDELGLLAREGSEPVGLEAIVTDGPRRLPAAPYNPLATLRQDERSTVEVEVAAIRDRAQWRAASGRVTLVVDGDMQATQQGAIGIGDRLRVFGHLAALAPPGNPGQFDFAASARAERRLTNLRAEFPEAVVRTAAGSSWHLQPWIERLRRIGVELLYRNLAGDEAGLASAMFLGAREDLDPERYDAFMETGTVHVLVISGFNVAILALCLRGLLGSLGMSSRSTMLAIAGVTLIYALVTGANPPVVRATVVVLLMCAALLVGYRLAAANLWGAAVLVVLTLNPSELFRSGAQLSFLGMAGLILIENRFGDAWGRYDPLERLIARGRSWPVRGMLGARDWAGRVLLVSLVVWLVVSPLVAARFHLLSPAAIVLGPLVAVPVTLAMAAGLGVLVLGAIAPPLALVCGWLCAASLAAVEQLTEWARHWPAGHFWVAGPSDWWLVGAYAAAALWATGLIALPRRWTVALAAGWCAVGLSASWIAANPWSASSRERLDCTFVSVGHGSAVVLRLPGGQTLLYDAGCMGSPSFAERAISAVLWHEGIRHLDAVILSHADADHYNALPGLLKRFSVGVVHVTPLMFDRSSPALDALARGIAVAGVPIDLISAGDRLVPVRKTPGTVPILRSPRSKMGLSPSPQRFADQHAGDDLSIEVLHPPRRGVLGSDNANSIVSAVEFAGRRILLTGDLESPGLDDVLAEEPYDCDILMAPHHGSRYSDPPNMARWSSPEWVVISGSRSDWQPTVAGAYSERGATVLHTARSGAVRATIADGHLSVTAWRK